MARKQHDNFFMTAEHIGMGVPKDAADFDTPAWRGYDILTHTPPEKRWTDELHARGIKSMPYMTLCYQYIDDAGAGWAAGETPDAVIIDQAGRPQLHENYRRHDGKWIYEICTNTRKARDLYLKRAEMLMQSGCDGLFLDNAAAARRCWGPQFGVHEHIHAGDPNARAEGHLGFCYPKAARRYRLEIPVADEEQTYSTAMLIQEIRDLVLSYNRQNRIMLNGGEGSSLPPIFYQNSDSVMNEMFIYTTYLDFNFPAPTHLDFMDHTPLDWMNVLAWQKAFADNARMNCLSAFSPHDPARRRHAIFAFCSAKLWDALFCTTSDPTLDAWLRDIRLGEPLTNKPGSWGAVFYREFEHGLVLTNPFGIAQQATVPWTNKPTKIIVHGDTSKVSHGAVEAGQGSITLKLGPDCAALILPGE